MMAVGSRYNDRNRTGPPERRLGERAER